MVVKDLLLEGVNELRLKKDINAQLEVRLILSYLLKVDKSYLYGHSDEEISLEISEKFRDIIALRKKGTPMAYILNEKEFMGMNLFVEEGVLIPRGDTEIIVEYIIEYINNIFGENPFSLLDIGIGSGAISLAIAKNFPNGNIIGIDFFEKPLKIAEKNRVSLELENVKFIKSNLFSSLNNNNFSNYFDIIVSNPPYIPEADIEELDADVRGFEPKEALSGGEDGLDFYRAISKDAKLYLKENGLLVYEIGYNQASSVESILSHYGYKCINAKNDLEDRNRLISAMK
ncbi:MAG: peptide chain release factor N(5)-glutamine methyltransferase [Gudongella sp.]|nr:peptide chain release factor N(5)-glutamine methyltransferase [Gudongella sp.]